MTTPAQHRNNTVTPREIVVACLHPKGACISALLETTLQRHQVAARELCDGFGAGVSFTEALERDPAIFWDWSHVRDSSDEAIRAASRYLVDVLVKSDEIVEALDAIVAARS